MTVDPFSLPVDPFSFSTAKTNRKRFDEGLGLLRTGLAPFVERELKATCRGTWLYKVRPQFSDKTVIPREFTQ